jgi:hypothetical protein
MAVTSTTETNYEQLASGAHGGAQVKGFCRQVIAPAASTQTLTKAQSGALCLFNSAAGVVFTLPTIDEAADIGMNFEFLVTTSVTSNAHKVITGAATEFLVGGIIMGDVTVAQSGDYFEANGTSHVEISGEGSTTGGLLGERYEVTAVSLTQWAINGVCHGAGTLADPFG